MQKKWIMLAVVLMVAPSVMAEMGMGLQLSGGGNMITINIVDNPLPQSVSAEIVTSGSIEGTLLVGYDADLRMISGETASPWHFDVTSAANTATGWTVSGSGVLNVTNDLLDHSTRDAGEVTTGGQIASVDSTGLGIAWGAGQLANITINIAAGAAQGTYVVGLDLTQGWTYVSCDDWGTYVPDTTSDLTIKLTPEPASALLLLLGGLPLLRRRRVA